MNMQDLPFSPVGPVPNARQLEWWGRERTAFLHFGINTFTGNEWGDGTENPALFNPTELDCRQWIFALKAAGFTAAILTAKHHDGFCLWPTKYTEHSVKNSPYKGGKGDIVREFTDACRLEGIKAGLYLSPWDRHEPTWGSDAYNDFYVGQLEELMSGYGKIWNCWWDGAGSTKTKYDWERWVNTLRRYQPDAVIFGSFGATPWVDVRWIGNEIGYASIPCWSTIDPTALEQEIGTLLNKGDPCGTAYIPPEADVSIRPGWFYHEEQDTMVRSPKNLTDLWFHSIGRGTGWLLNLPPDRRGLLHEADVRALRSFADTLSENLSKNLAKGATLTATSIRGDGYAPGDALAEGEGCYAPQDGCLTPVLTVTFDAPTAINTVAFGEPPALGHRIRAYRVEALVDSEWKVLFTGESVGAYCARRIDPVTAEAIRISVTEAIAEPMLYKLGVYLFREAEEAEGTVRWQNLAGWSSTVTYGEEGLVLRLRGIYPFDLLRLPADGITRFAIDLFDGTDFHEYTTVTHTGKGECEYRFPERITFAYQLRLRVLEPAGVTLTEANRPKLF